MAQPVTIVFKAQDESYHLCGPYGESQTLKYKSLKKAQDMRDVMNGILKYTYGQHPDWKPKWL